MDNVKLSKEQLHQLIAYIEKRGFHSPLVIVEILDHFASKVEEKMAAHPTPSLDEAMESAHADFGALGFYPLLKSYEAGVKKKYKAVYNGERRKVFANPLCVITAIIAGSLFYKAMYWNQMNGTKTLLIFSNIDITLMLSAILFSALAFFKFKLNRKKNPILDAISTSDRFVIICLGLIASSSDHYHSPQTLPFFQITGAIIVFYYIIWLFTMYATLKKGYNDSAIYYEYLETIQ